MEFSTRDNFYPFNHSSFKVSFYIPQIIELRNLVWTHWWSVLLFRVDIWGQTSMFAARSSHKFAIYWMSKTRENSPNLWEENTLQLNWDIFFFSFFFPVSSFYLFLLCKTLTKQFLQDTTKFLKICLSENICVFVSPCNLIQR